MTQGRRRQRNRRRHQNLGMRLDDVPASSAVPTRSRHVVVHAVTARGALGPRLLRNERPSLLVTLETSRERLLYTPTAEAKLHQSASYLLVHCFPTGPVHRTLTVVSHSRLKPDWTCVGGVAS